MAAVLALTTGPSPASRTALLAEHTAASLPGPAAPTPTYSPCATCPPHRCSPRTPTTQSIARALRLVAEADSLVVATPIHQAACSGLLKTFLDLLPQHAFTGKPVLLLATGGSPAHVMALDHALHPVLTALGAHVTQGRFALDRHIMTASDGTTAFDHDDELQLGRAIEQFARTFPPHAHLTAV